MSDKAVDRAKILQGGESKYHEKAAQEKKLFARRRIELLFDPGTQVAAENGIYANALSDEWLPADGVVTVFGRVHGREVAVIANDSTIKAGSWGARTVEKILRMQEAAERNRIPLIYLIDSAGARITDQVEMFPGRRGAGRIFYNQVWLSGVIPQVCALFGPSAAGGAYIPAFCDVVFMVDKNASMYLGSPRMAEMVIGEKTTLEELGGARMHTGKSGCGDFLCKTEEEAITGVREYLRYMPDHSEQRVPAIAAAAPSVDTSTLGSLIPANENQPFDVHTVIDALFDAGSFFEVKERFAKELVTGFARLNGEVVGIVANNSKYKGGVLFIDSADKAARFVWLCKAFNIPLVFLADVPGFMIGKAVEEAGIIRHGAKMIFAMSEATVPKICVVLRKAYGAGLYAMSGPGFDPECTLALPTAMIAVMGPQAAVNAVYYNKIQAIADEAERTKFVEDRRREYAEDVNINRLASELVVDEIVQPEHLRRELIARLSLARNKVRRVAHRRNGVIPG